MRLSRRKWSCWPALCILTAMMCVPFAGTLFATTYAVDVVDNEYVPKTLVIEPGDTVVWTNQTGTAHTVDADDDSFASGVLSFGQRFRQTFTAVGRIPYFCQLHGGPGGQDMSGVIRVVAPGANEPPATPAAVTPVPGAVNQSIAPTLTASAFSDTDAGDTHAASQWIIRNLTTNAVTDTGEDTGHKTSLPLTGLTFSTGYAWKVRYRDDRGAWSEYSAEISFTTVAGNAGVGTGLSASYGKYVVKTGVATIIATTIDPKIDFDWKLLKPFLKVPSNNFFVRWEGKLVPEFSERYRFHVKADGGVRLWVNGQPVIDDWIAGKFAIFRNGLINLDAGVPITIKLEYFDTLTTSSVSLRWSSRSLPTEVVPQEHLYPLTP